MHLALHNANPNPLVEGPTLVLASVHSKACRRLTSPFPPYPAALQGCRAVVDNIDGETRVADPREGGLGSELGRLVGRVALVFPPPLHAVAIKPSTVATISRFIGRSLRGSNREAGVLVGSNPTLPRGAIVGLCLSEGIAPCATTFGWKSLYEQGLDRDNRGQ